MAEEDRLDIITVSDEEGKELLLKVEKYFYYNGEEYVYLRPAEDDDEAQPADDGSRDYVMRVEVSRDEEGEEIEDFVPLERELMDSLIKSARISYTIPREDSDADPS